MTACEQHLFPAAQSASAFAVRPFGANYMNTHCDGFLLSPTEKVPTEKESPNSLSPQAGEPVVERIDPASDAIPAYRPATPTLFKPPYGPIATLRCIQIQTVLLRCQVLQTTIQSLASKPCLKTIHNPAHHHYETMTQLVHSARQLAAGTHNTQLQARCEYWAGRACAGTNDLRAAVAHLKRARALDGSGDGDTGTGGGGFRFTARERRERDCLLQRVVEYVEKGGDGGGVDVLLGVESAGWEFTEREKNYVQIGTKVRDDEQEGGEKRRVLSLERELGLASYSGYDVYLGEEGEVLWGLFGEE